jgi:hypothetical protein
MWEWASFEKTGGGSRGRETTERGEDGRRKVREML